jgi:hypothetical protein
MKKLEKMKSFELKNISSIWGGAGCYKYTQKVDYTSNPETGKCEVDETCWECDDVTSSGSASGASGAGA